MNFLATPVLFVFTFVLAYLREMHLYFVSRCKSNLTRSLFLWASQLPPSHTEVGLSGPLIDRVTAVQCLSFAKSCFCLQFNSISPII